MQLLETLFADEKIMLQKIHAQNKKRITGINSIFYITQTHNNRTKNQQTTQ